MTVVTTAEHRHPYTIVFVHREFTIHARMEPPNRTAAIFSLSNELLDEVVKNLPVLNGDTTLDKVNLKALSELSLTCKKFRTITEPFMYRNLVAKHNGPRLRSFIKTLKQRPELGEHVKTIHLVGGDLVNQDIVKELIACCKALKDFRYILSRDHFMVPVQANWPELVTLLFSQQQTLESLTLDVLKDDRWGQSYIPWSHNTIDCFSKGPLPSLANFTNLRVLTVGEKILYGLPTGLIRGKDMPINRNLLADLPSSIKVINITECNPCSKNTRVQLAAFLEAVMANSFLALESIKTTFERNDCHTETMEGARLVILWFEQLAAGHNNLEVTDNDDTNSIHSDDSNDDYGENSYYTYSSSPGYAYGDDADYGNSAIIEGGTDDESGGNGTDVASGPEEEEDNELLSSYFKSLSGISLRDRTLTIDYKPIVAEWKEMKDGFEEAGVRFIEEL